MGGPHLEPEVLHGAKGSLDDRGGALILLSDSIRCISPQGFLGNGFDVQCFERALGMDPAFVGVDAGSVDPGPYYLGTSRTLVPQINIDRDLEVILLGARRLKVPLIVGSAFQNGTNKQLHNAIETVQRIAHRHGLKFRLSAIEAELDKDWLRGKLRRGDITPLMASPELTEDTLGETSVLIAQMGVEPLVKALDEGADVVLAGRSCDDAIFAALPVRKGFDRGLALHMGKVLECGSTAADPWDPYDNRRIPMIGELFRDRFIVYPSDEGWFCSPRTVAAHSFYERDDPIEEPGPGGIVDTRQCHFAQLDKSKVEVRGSRFVPADEYRVKVEGVTPLGHRSIVIAGLRDPDLIANLGGVLTRCRETVARRFAEHGVMGKDYHLLFREYGKNGVMGILEQVRFTGHEVGLVIEAIAPDPDTSMAVCGYSRSTLADAHYPDERATSASNLAYPFSPFVIYCGEAYAFSVYHTVRLDDPVECFRIQMLEVS